MTSSRPFATSRRRDTTLVHPLGIFLIGNRSDDHFAPAANEYFVGICQIVPEKHGSVAEYVRRHVMEDRELLAHSVVFSMLSYAEAQTAVRDFVAAESGATRIDRRSKILRGNGLAMRRVLWEMGLDSSAFHEHYRDGLSDVEDAESESSDDDATEEDDEDADWTVDMDVKEVPRRVLRSAPAAR
jgi:hypothetical protein